MHTRTFALILRLLALAVFLVGALHLALGVRAGEKLHASALLPPAATAVNTPALIIRAVALLTEAL